MWFANPARRLLPILPLTLLLTACEPTRAEPDKPDGTPMLQAPVAGEPTNLQEKERHHQNVELIAGDFIRVLVNQVGSDVTVRLLGPDGRSVAEVDSRNGSNGFEDLVAIVHMSGLYKVEIEAGPGGYVLHEIVHRPATENDRIAVAADTDFWRAQTAYYKTRDYQETTALYEKSLAGAVQTGWQRREIDSLLGLSRAHSKLLNLRLASVLAEEALEVFETHDDSRGRDTVLSHAGWLRLRRGQHARAIPFLEEAVELFNARGYATGAALAQANLGTAYHQMGEQRLAGDWFDNALTWVDKIKPVNEATIRSDYADMFLNLRNLEKAYEQYNLALKLLRREKGKYASHLALALEGVAFAAAQLGKIAEAEAAITEAIEVAGENRRATFDGTLGFIRWKKGDLDGARQAYEEALRRAQDMGELSQAAVYLARLGQLAIENGDPQAGLTFFEKAGAVYEEIEDPRGQALSLAHAARALAQQERLNEAWQKLERALFLVEGIRSDLDRQTARTDYFGSRRSYYELAMDVLVQAERLADALDVNERWRMRELHEALARLSQEALQADPATSAQRESALNLQKTEARLLRKELTQAVSEPRSTPGRDALIVDLLGQLEKAEAQLRRKRAKAPEAWESMDFQRLRKSLDSDTVLLSYALGEEQSFVWTLSKGGWHAAVLPERAEIEKMAVRFNKALSNVNQRSQDKAAESGRELAEILLAPVAQDLKRRIVLITDGALEKVPFAALPHPLDGEFLLRRHELVSIPSVSILLAQRDSRQPATLRALIFADPVTDPKDPRLREVPGTIPEKIWQRLPHAASEGRKVRETLGQKAELFEGFEASRETFEESLDAGILHFVSHALTDENSALSKLVLSLFNESGESLNGNLRAFEISRWNLAAQLVVLSACQTGLGEDLPGEGMQGLARAFMEAGADRVLYTLWDVDDAATAKLMPLFYENLVSHSEPSAALREAQLALMDTVSPNQWAAFVLLGDWQPLEGVWK